MATTTSEVPDRKKLFKTCFTFGKLHVYVVAYPGTWIYSVRLQGEYGIAGLPDRAKVQGSLSLNIHNVSIHLFCGHNFYIHPTNKCPCGVVNPNPVNWGSV